MKKLLIILSLSLLFTSCSGVENITYDLSPEKEAEYQDMLDENFALLESDSISEGDYNEALKNIAVSYQRLGETQKAIDYYELLLERHESNYTALNNLTAIYHELEMWDEATEYALLYFNFYGSKEATADRVIRIFVEAGDYDEAQRILEFFASNYGNAENGEFISDTYEYIARVRNKNASVENSEGTE